MRFDFQMRPDNHGRLVVRYKDLLSEVPSPHLLVFALYEMAKVILPPGRRTGTSRRTAVLQPGHAMLCALSWTAASAALSTDSSGLAASLRVQNQAGQWQATLELFRAAKAGGADRSSYTEAIVAHGRLRQSDKALNVFREMQDAGLTPNVVSCAQRAWGPLPHCQLSLTPRPHHASCAQTRPRSPRAGARATGRSRSRSSQTCKRTVSRPTPTPSTRSAASRAHSRLCPPPPS